MKKIGLSLSFCVLDILQGKVHLKDVLFIYSGTKAATSEDINKVVEGYSLSYWFKFSEDKINKVLDALITDGKFIQPRLEGRTPPNIARGYWVTEEEFEARFGKGAQKEWRETHPSLQ